MYRYTMSKHSGNEWRGPCQVIDERIRLLLAHVIARHPGRRHSFPHCLLIVYRCTHTRSLTVCS